MQHNYYHIKNTKLIYITHKSRLLNNTEGIYINDGN